MNDLPRSFKVVRTDRELEMPLADARLREAGAQLVLLPDGTPEAVLAREVADADLLLMCYTPVTEAVIAGATRLKAIVKYGVGIDAIDIVAARARGIPVVNVPTYAEETVAEGAFALLMALFKRFKPLQHAMQTEGWAWPEARWLAHDLAGKTLGLVGLGRIGRSMARMAGAFRMRVLAYDPHVAAEAMPAGVQRCDTLAELLRASDAVSVHCVLNAQTRQLLGAAAAGADEAHGLPGERVARRDRRRGGAAAGAAAAALRRRRARRLRPRAVVTPRSCAVGTLRNGQRHAVAASDLLHAGGDAAPGRRDAGPLLRGLARPAAAAWPRSTRACARRRAACASSTPRPEPQAGHVLYVVDNRQTAS